LIAKVLRGCIIDHEFSIAIIGENEITIMSWVKWECCVYSAVKMDAVFFRIGYANGKFARSIRLPCAAELSFSHVG
jgi:hypothetical protein